MSLIARAEALERERRSLSLSRFGHTGAHIPGYEFDWQAEALALETRLAGAVEALRDSAETLHRISTDPEHFDRTFAECQAEYCVKARVALGGQ